MEKGDLGGAPNGSGSGRSGEAFRTPLCEMSRGKRKKEGGMGLNGFERARAAEPASEGSTLPPLPFILMCKERGENNHEPMGTELIIEIKGVIAEECSFLRITSPLSKKHGGGGGESTWRGGSLGKRE